jgi:hypothetical protein
MKKLTIFYTVKQDLQQGTFTAAVHNLSAGPFPIGQPLPSATALSRENAERRLLADVKLLVARRGVRVHMEQV